MDNLQVLAAVAVMALVTFLLRFLPFLMFGGKRKTPEYIKYLGNVLPFSIMAMLVVYCIRELNFVSAANFVPQIISCLIVVLLYLWKRNTLVSIVVGTGCYMLLVQFVF